MAESIRDISGLGLEELKALLVQALEDNTRLKAENAVLREEIARLKGLKGRPKLKPSGMEKAAETAGATGGKRKGRRGAKRSKLSLDETRILKPDSLPEGARFKGYEDFIVQDIVIMPWTVRYRRERWLLPSGETVLAVVAKGRRRPFRGEPQALCAEPIPPGAGHNPAACRAADRFGHRDFQAADRSAAYQQAGRFRQREHRSAARGTCVGVLADRRRYGRPA
jgi:hypothetical protein